MAHSHDNVSAGDLSLPPQLRRILVACIAGFLVATVVGLVVLWPPGTASGERPSELGTPVQLVNARVTASKLVPCGSTLPGPNLVCRSVTVTLDQGPEKGTATALDITDSPDQPTLRVGDRIILGRSADPTGVAYYFSDYQRRAPLLALGLLFAIAVIGLARWRGAAALAGLVISLVVLVRFALPAILAGENALAVAIVSAAIIAFLIVYWPTGSRLAPPPPCSAPWCRWP